MGAPLGDVQVPPGSGVPPSQEKGGSAGALAQREITFPVPASGACTTVIVTVLLTEVHGAGAFTVYVYAPGTSALTENIGPCGVPFGAIQLPPGEGDPANANDRL